MVFHEPPWIQYSQMYERLVMQLHVTSFLRSILYNLQHINISPVGIDDIDTKISWIILNTLELVLMTRGAGSPHDEGDDNKGRNKTKNENRESTSARRRTTPPPTTTKMTRTGKGVTYASGNYDFRGSLLFKNHHRSLASRCTWYTL